MNEEQKSSMTSEINNVIVEILNNGPTFLSGAQTVGQVILEGKKPEITEQDYYNVNGISKSREVSKQEFENDVSKKTSIVYKAYKLQLKKKPDLAEG